MDTQVMDVDTLRAGPALDLLIAEKVMGLKEGVDYGAFPEHKISTFEDSEGKVDSCDRCFWDDTMEPEPCYVEADEYSKRIAMAWEVVEHMWGKHYHFSIVSLIKQNGAVVCDATFYPYGHKPEYHGEGHAPLAICRAALKAVLKP